MIVCNVLFMKVSVCYVVYLLLLHYWGALIGCPDVSKKTKITTKCTSQYFYLAAYHTRITRITYHTEVVL